ncbi:hypothetical protein [Spirulina major]|uniref:hypothetical protein n=1 Tax=Spirulina major TaxID=270636 RepID=UPI001587C47D|nr:hypothetical protein [Spirulina major]
MPDFWDSGLLWGGAIANSPLKIVAASLKAYAMIMAQSPHRFGSGSSTASDLLETTEL